MNNTPEIKPLQPFFQSKALVQRNIGPFVRRIKDSTVKNRT